MIAVFGISLAYERLLGGYARVRRVLVVGDDERAESVAWELDEKPTPSSSASAWSALSTAKTGTRTLL